MPARSRCQRQPRRKVHRRPYAAPEVYRDMAPRIKAMARAAAPYLALLALALAVWGYSAALWDVAYGMGVEYAQR